MVWGLYRHIGFRQEGGNTHTISLIFFLYRIMSIVCIPIVIVRAWFYCVQEPGHNKNIIKLVPEFMWTFIIPANSLTNRKHPSYF